MKKYIFYQPKIYIILNIRSLESRGFSASILSILGGFHVQVDEHRHKAYFSKSIDCLFRASFARFINSDKNIFLLNGE